MVAALNLNTVKELPKMEQGVRGIRQAEEPVQSFSANKADGANIVHFAAVVKANNDGAVANTNKSKYDEALEKLEKAIDDLDKKQAVLDEKQKKVDELKEKMNSTKNIFKKAGYAIAYGVATAGLWVAKKAVQAAEGAVMIARETVDYFKN